ncbi:DUF1515 family protein [Rhizobium binxianense]
MSPPEIDAAVHQQLGELVAGMRSLQEANRRFEDMMRRSEDKSAESRASMHRRMDEFVDRIGKVETNVTTVQDDVRGMKPTVEKITAWEQRGIGALFVVGVGSAAITYIMTKFSAAIFAWLTAK